MAGESTGCDATADHWFGEVAVEAVNEEKEEEDDEGNCYDPSSRTCRWLEVFGEMSGEDGEFSRASAGEPAENEGTVKSEIIKATAADDEPL